jgi:hypothetical protein
MDSAEPNNHQIKRRPEGPSPVAVCTPGAAPAAGPREPVTLVKGPHRWTFACEPGDEPELLRRLSELAAAPDAAFDWFDAALVTHQLSRRLRPGLQRIDGGSTGTSP